MVLTNETFVSSRSSGQVGQRKKETISIEAFIVRFELEGVIAGQRMINSLTQLTEEGTLSRDEQGGS